MVLHAWILTLMMLLGSMRTIGAESSIDINMAAAAGSDWPLRYFWWQLCVLPFKPEWIYQKIIKLCSKLVSRSWLLKLDVCQSALTTSSSNTCFMPTQGIRLTENEQRLNNVFILRSNITISTHESTVLRMRLYFVYLKRLFLSTYDTWCGTI